MVYLITRKLQLRIMKKLYNKLDKETLLKKLGEESSQRVTLSFYQYANIPDPHAFRNKFYSSLDELGVLGRIYVAKEGVNAQISVPENRFDQFKIRINEIPFLKGVRLNIAIEDDGKSFIKLKIKVRDKIVADGLDDENFDPTDRGKHLSAEEFNALTDAENTILIDMRNHYESEVGHFKNAVTPDVETFRESLPIIEEMLTDKKDENIVMYCTGGIRCEKASAYFKHKGFKNVHQLDGGIIEYARQAEEKGLENKFIGKNFVFDDRMGERISADVISYCHQCGSPCDEHTNCANDACHILFIQCAKCAEKLDACCSEKCMEFIKLPIEEQERQKGMTEFNGTKFGKGRYKASKKGKELNTDQ